MVTLALSDLNRVIDDDPETWPWLAPIREIDEKTDTLRRHDFDNDDINVLNSLDWKQDIRLAKHILDDLFHALSDESNRFDALEKRAQKCIDDCRKEIEGTDRWKYGGTVLRNEHALHRLEKILKFCEKNKTAAVAVADEHVDEVANILGYKVLSSRRELCRDDMAW